MSGTTWSKFYWSDWQSDPALRLCSYAARGLWMDLLCIAAAHDPIGYVAVAGRALDETSIARLTGGQESEVRSLLGELARAGVFSCDRQGRIYSRRMVADARRAAIARKNGKNGGNPNLRKQKGNPDWDNPPVKGGLKPHKPEAISHKKDTVASDEPIATSEGKDEPWKRDADFQTLWSVATPEARRRAKSQAKVWPEWRKAKRTTPTAVIVAGMGAYLAGDPDVKRTGGPGLHLWLRDRTWESWTADTGDPMGHDWPEDRWAIAIDIWRKDQAWDARLGPEPGDPGCRAPKHLLIETARAA